MTLTASYEALLSYVPTVVARHLAAAPDPDQPVWAERFPAAVMFVDVVGFTPLTRLLEQRGDEGVEELSRLMNRYWDPLIELVAAHGGDIVKFSGDAVLVVWPVCDANRTRATARAARCGVAVAARFSSFEAAESIRLSNKVSILSGELMVAGVKGLGGRWRFLVAGACLADLEAAGAHARPGDVILSAEAWASLSHTADGQVFVDGMARLTTIRVDPDLASDDDIEMDPGALPIDPLPSIDQDHLRAYVPDPVLARFDVGQAEWMAEFRRVTLLFVNIVGIVYGTQDVLYEFERLLHDFEAIVQRYQGLLKDVRIDDKGTTFIAVLGGPPAAHEDDPVRGVLAAQAFVKAVHALGLQCKVGVATGRTFCGHIGNTRRRDYDINGDAVPLAARLMIAAEPDNLLCDEATVQAARARIEFEELPRFQLKGVDGPVAVYRPAAVGAESLRTGHVSEHSQLRRRLEELRTGRGGLIVVEGEPGIGKSHLMRTLAFDARGLDIRCIVSSTDDTERSTSYFAWREVFSELCGIDPWVDPHIARGRALALIQVDDNVAHLAPLFNAVLSLDLPENEGTAQMVGQVRADNTQVLLVQLLRAAAAETPLMLILEDCHWLDSASRALIGAATLEAPGMLLILTTRPFAEGSPPDYDALVLAAGNQRLQLQPFRAEQTGGLLRELLHVRQVSKSIVTFIGERAEGNAFFIQELAYALRDRHLIVVVDGECRFAQSDGAPLSLDLPTTVEGLVTSRIDQLEAGVQLTLKVAAVIGRSFTYESLEAIHPVDADRPHLRRHLETLERASLCQHSGDQPDVSYSFTHVITQQVAYELLPFEQRRRLHHALAQTYEQRCAGDVEPVLPLLAHNYRLAGDHAKALEYLERAGDQALGLFNNEQAVQFFEAAVALAAHARPAPESARRAHWELQLGQAQINLSRYVDGVDHLNNGLALVGRTVPRTFSGQALNLVGALAQQLLHRLWPARYVGRARVDQRRLLPVHSAYLRLAEAYYYGNQAPLLLSAAIVHALNTAEDAGSPAELAEAYATMGGLMGIVPVRRWSEGYFQRAVAIAEASGTPPGHLLVWIVAGMYYVGVGNWPKAEQFFQHVITVSSRLGDRRRWMDGVSNVYWIHEFKGEFAPIEAMARDLLGVAERQRDPRYQVEALVRLAWSDLNAGVPDLALLHLDQTAALFAGHPEIIDAALQLELCGLYSIAHLRGSSPRQAFDAADGALKLTSGSRPFSYFLSGYAGAAEVYLTLLEANFAQPDLAAKATQACHLLRCYTRVFPIGLPRLRICEGLLYWNSGKPADARHAWLDGLAAATRLDMRCEQGLAHYQLGRHLPPSDVDREYHLQHASDLFEACGAHYYRSMVDIARDPSR